MKKIIWALPLLFFVAVNTNATQLYFNFAGCPASAVSACPGDFGTNQATYTDQGYSVTVYGYSGSIPADLFLTEGVGLGLAGTPGNKVNAGEYLYVQAPDVFVNSGVLWILRLDSLQADQNACVSGTSELGAPGAPCAPGGNGIDMGGVGLGFESTFVSLTPTSGALLLTDLRTVPEPPTLELLALGLVGLCLWRGKRMQSRRCQA